MIVWNWEGEHFLNPKLLQPLAFNISGRTVVVISHGCGWCPKDPSLLAFTRQPLLQGGEHKLTQLLAFYVIQIEQKECPRGIKMYTWMTPASFSLERSKSQSYGGWEAWNKSRLIQHVRKVWIIYFLTLPQVLFTAVCCSLFWGTIVTRVSQAYF